MRVDPASEADPGIRPTFSYHIDDELEVGLLEERHSTALYALVERNREQLARWLPWVDGFRSPDGSATFRRDALTQFAEGNGFQGGIWYQGRLVGTVGLHYLDPTAGNTEIGYWLDQGHQGKGIMTRVVAGLCRLLFVDYGLHRIEIRSDPQNRRSRAVAERLGFKEEGVLREKVALRGSKRDQVVYSLLEPEWRQRQEKV